MAGYVLLNNGAVRQLASKVLFENVVQNIMVVPGRSADFRYIDDIGAKMVTVNRVKLAGESRQLGQATNGAYFNAATGASESQLFDIPLDNVFDTPIKVARVQDDMSGGLALKGMLMNVPKSIARAVNCTYFGTLIAANLNAAISATSANDTVTYATSSSYVTKIAADTTAGVIAGTQAAMANLGAGDVSNGFDIFPLEESTIYGTPDYLNYLRGQANFIVNNPIGQTMIASGSFSAFGAEVTPNSINGFQGEVYGMLLYHVGALFGITEGYIGLETLADGALEAITATALSNLLAIVVCGRAVGGGMTPGNVQVVDARGGQGWEIQPLARFGFSVFSPKGVQLITKAAGLNETHFKPYTGAAAVATQAKKTVIYQPGNRA